MKRFCALLGFSLAVLAQDESKIQELIGKLSDDDVQVRETATKALIQLGEAALPALQKIAETGTEVDLKESARKIIDEINRTKSFRQVYNPPLPLTLSFKGKLSDLAKDLQQKTGCAFSFDADTDVEIDVKQAPLFQALDTICRKNGGLVYHVDGQKGIRFEKGTFVEYPTFYSEAFRVRILRVEKYIRSTFDKKEAAIAVMAEGESLPGVKPVCKPSIDLEKLLDDSGTDLKTTDKQYVLGDTTDPNAKNPFGINIMQNWLGGNPLDRAQVFIFVVDPSVKKLKGLKGSAHYYFRMDPKELKVEDLSKTRMIEFEGFKITVGAENGMSSIVQINGANKQVKNRAKVAITLTPKNDSDRGLGMIADQMLVPDSVIAIDDKGKAQSCEAEWHVSPNVTVVNNQVKYNNTGQWVVTLPEGVKRDEVKELRFKMGTLEKKVVSFELGEIELP